MKQITLLLIASASVGLAGCSKTDNYTPPANASGEDIFYANCTKCHKPETGSVMALNTRRQTKRPSFGKFKKAAWA